MPIYEYRCENGHTFEVLQRMTDEPLSKCQECGAPVQRVFHPVAVHFKGSGFYTTDYGRKKSATGGSDSGPPDSSSKDSSSSSDSKAKSDSKSSKDSSAKPD
jgi:putative FmdB family regulatory protein